MLKRLTALLLAAAALARLPADAHNALLAPLADCGDTDEAAAAKVVRNALAPLGLEAPIQWESPEAALEFVLNPESIQKMIETPELGPAATAEETISKALNADDWTDGDQPRDQPSLKAKMRNALSSISDAIVAALLTDLRQQLKNADLSTQKTAFLAFNEEILARTFEAIRRRTKALSQAFSLSFSAEITSFNAEFATRVEKLSGEVLPQFADLLQLMHQPARSLTAAFAKILESGSLVTQCQNRGGVLIKTLAKMHDSDAAISNVFGLVLTQKSDLKNDAKAQATLDHFLAKILVQLGHTHRQQLGESLIQAVELNDESATIWSEKIGSFLRSFIDENTSTLDHKTLAAIAFFINENSSLSNDHYRLLAERFESLLSEGGLLLQTVSWAMNFLLTPIVKLKKNFPFYGTLFKHAQLFAYQSLQNQRPLTHQNFDAYLNALAEGGAMIDGPFFVWSKTINAFLGKRAGQNFDVSFQVPTARILDVEAIEFSLTSKKEKVMRAVLDAASPAQACSLRKQNTEELITRFLAGVHPSANFPTDKTKYQAALPHSLRMKKFPEFVVSSEHPQMLDDGWVFETPSDQADPNTKNVQRIFRESIEVQPGNNLSQESQAQQQTGNPVFTPDVVVFD